MLCPFDNVVLCRAEPEYIDIKASVDTSEKRILYNRQQDKTDKINRTRT